MRSRLEVLRPIAAIALAAVFFFPIYIVVMGMLKPADKIQSSPLGLPLQPTGENLGAVLGRSDGLFWSALLNSVQITVLSVVLLTLLSAMLAHYLVRSHALWTKPAMLVLLAGLMIPPAVILQPVTQVLGAAGLMNSVVGVVASNVAYYLPFGVFVFSGFVGTVPVEIEEAASIDGASRFRLFWQVVFPIMRPAAASVMIFLGVWVWNDFLTPLIILGPEAGTTVTVGVYRSVGEYSTNFGTLYAFSFLASLPVLLFFVALQKQFVAGLTAGSVK
ncbi:MAG TPA: carbohydrate ABC transporter permease [Kribbella sp.]|uniref:carbohydrate ABC transporter permease n=1 Tax=Kribbella sp. TaxID=1871183 RepID=UPI002D773909|nr:carbohydrate ABC transporter permease [Kribbella sp.]HET6297720.1 carbohydrate ABC transporter permease [Kribbella sp.]